MHIVGYSFKLIDNSRAKQHILTYFFAGWNATALKDLGQKYALERIPQIIRPEALKRIQWHLSEGHEVAIVSASPEIWISAWSNTLGIKLIGTLLEENEGNITGKYNGLNCHGEEKVSRIKRVFNLEKYDRIYAYGDSPGDQPMLSLADEAYSRQFS